MHAAGALGCENISLAKPGDINMCTSIRTSWQKDSQQLSGTPSGKPGALNPCVNYVCDARLRYDV